MDTLYQDLTREFLQAGTVALFGFSRKGDAVANGLFDKFNANGIPVVIIHPQAGELKGKPAFSSVAEATPKPVAAMICTHPSQATAVVRASLDAGIRLFWFHRSVDEGSFSEEAARLAMNAGAKVIPGGCPMMFIKPDIAHRCIKFFIRNSPKFRAEPWNTPTPVH